ncbi:MAG: Calx-beta domain-containing protein, partial [Planctomycetaceae bacterium]
TVQVVSADGSATEGEDYSAVIETLVFEDGVTSQTFFVTVTNDAAEEPDETITLTLENPTGGAELAFREQMRVTIVDNDGETDEATIRIADSRVVESDDGEQFIEFEVTRSDNEGAPSVSWTTADGTATAGEDYEQTSGTVAFTDGGDLTQTVRVPVLGDTLVERDETFIVRLSDAVDAVINDDQATGTIEDDDSATISIGDISLTEGDSGSRVFRFEISVDAEIDQPVTFNATTVDGTASSNDYSANDDSLSIQTSDTNTMFEVTVFGDTNFEPDETFFVNLSGLNAGGRDVTFATAQSLGTILNDDEDNGDTNPCSEVRPDDGAFLTDDGTLFIVGTGGSDVLRTSERRKRLYTWVNRDRESWNPDEVDRIVMCGFDGRDRVKRSGASRSRHAFMDGGDGYDFLRGGTGSDTIHGGDGRDTLIGGKGDDELHGGRGDDRLRGQHGQDLLDGGGGNDRLYGGNGSDVVLGGTGSDSVLGNGGHDLLIGGNDRDTVKGGGGHDLVIGGAVSLPVPDLRDILDEWTESGRSVEQRIANIRGDNPSNDRHNEVAFLNVDSIADDARDILFGCGGTDWFFASVDDHVKDQRDFEQLDTV